MIRSCVTTNAIYTIEILLSYRSASRSQCPSPATIRRLHELNILRRRRRGVRAGRKSKHPIRALTTTRISPKHHHEIRPPALVIPLRLSIKETQENINRDQPISSSHASTSSIVNSTSSTGHSITIEFLNIQSILPKLPDVRAELSSTDPDIMCFAETNLKPHTPSTFCSLSGYTTHRRDRKIGRKKSGGGVMIFAKDYMSVQLLNISSDNDESNVESLWLSAKVDNRRAFVICCIYRPPTTLSRQINADYDDIEAQLQKIITNQTPLTIIITGDFNSDPTTNPIAADRFKRLADYDLHTLITEPTFFRNDTSSCLDNILVSNHLIDSNYLVKTSVKPTNYTANHCKLSAVLRITRSKRRPTYCTRRSWVRVAEDSLLADVSSVPWNEIIRRDVDVESQWNVFHSVMLRIMNTHISLQRIKIRNARPPHLS
ncbi:Uncharacterised protein at_DN2442, partial [Pycnogonum litorale]